MLGGRLPLYPTAVDTTDVVHGLAAEGDLVDTDDLTASIEHTLCRMGDLVLNLSPPEPVPVTRLDPEQRMLCGSRA